jgi:DNA-binding transcriptional LysR family regulator
MRPLPPELLRSFVAIVNAGSFTAGAERVNVSQSTISQHVRRLEEIVGKPLLERDTRNVHPTTHGQALHGYALRILTLMDEAVASICGPVLNGQVRLGLSEDFASVRLAAVLASFVERNPDIELAIATGMSGDLFRELDEERHDLILAKRLSGSQRGRVVRTEPLFWCGNPGFGAADRGVALPLAVHPAPSVSRTRMFEALKAADRPYRVAVASSSVAVLKAAVSAGLGVSAFAGYLVPDGLTRIDTGLPALGNLEYVIDRPASVSSAAAALELTLAAAAADI